MANSNHSVGRDIRHLWCGLLCLWAVSACAPQQMPAGAPTVAVIVHPSNATSWLSDHALRSIFLKRELQWPASAGLSRDSIIALDLGADDPARAIFSERIFGKSTALMRHSWIAEGLKSGREPPLQRSAADVLKIVSRAPNAIGYVPASMVNSGVKVVRTL